MKWLESRVLWGIVLILVGIIFLVENLGLVQLSELFWGTLFGVSGAFFIVFFIQNRTNWWALIPGLTLISVGLLVLLNWIAPALGEVWGGSIVLAGIGISFLTVYLFDFRNWWALIPGGILLTLALAAGLDGINPGFRTAGVFFLGTGMTFAMVALLPTPQGDMRWAWIPSGILCVAGVIILMVGVNLAASLFPASLILLGVMLILRTLRRG